MNPIELSLGIALIVVVTYFSILILFIVYQFFFEDGGLIDQVSALMHEDKDSLW